MPMRSHSAVRKIISRTPRPRALLEPVELHRVPMRNTRGDVRLELAEDTTGPDEEPIEHLRLEEPGGPGAHAHHEAVRRLLDQRLPPRVDRPSLGGQGGRALEVHAGEIDEQVRV